MIYEPVVYRWARRRGLQDSDAQDIVQKVMLAVTREVERWESDPQRSRFRTWLYRVATNATLNVLMRDRRLPSAPAGLDAQAIDQLPACSEDDSDLLRTEYRREVFRWAARRVQIEFQPTTWEAFWLTTVQRLSVEEAATRLGKQPGAIYAARSRVMRRLKQVVLEYDAS
jgi:RNA polymerase sigma-70 factor (ECF subfamily)